VRPIGEPAPFGLGTLEYQYESDAAKEYEFKKADI
jgi:hypothetical protein